MSTSTDSGCVRLDVDAKGRPRYEHVSIFDTSSADRDSTEIASTWWNSNVWIRGKCSEYRRVMSTARVCQIIPWVVLSFGLTQIVIFLWFTDFLYKWMAFSIKSHLEVWRYFTYSLMHSTPVHLGINLIVQISAGMPLELEQGHLRTLFVYLSSIAAGAFASLRYKPEQTLVGASAGGFGLLISHLPHTLLNFEVLPYRYYRLIAVLIFCASDLIDTTISNALSQSSLASFEAPPPISKCAHMGGALCGVLLGLVVYKGHRGVILNVLRILSVCLIVAISVYQTVESSRVFA